MEIQQPKISVIVAVYNAEKYLRRCIDSLLAQTFTDFEVLLIDDGSTDSSGEICDEYAGQDCRFVVFHNANQGVASARAFGIDHARGEYTIHVDSDDWVENNYLSELYRYAILSAADIVVCDYVAERGYTSERVSQKFIGKSAPQVFQEILKGKVSAVCWNKLIKLDCYRRYNINFIPGINCGEDIVLVSTLFQQDFSVSYCPSTYYHYDQYISTNSYTRHINKETLAQREMAISMLLSINQNEENVVYILDRLHTIAYQAIRINAYNSRQFQERFEMLKKLPLSFRRKHPWQEQVFVWTSLYVGYGIAAFLMNLKLLYRKLRKSDDA